jgi:glutamyl-tRNA synthetase
MILRIDDTDVERNTDASLQSIYDGLQWLGLNWDEEYRQSQRLDLHRELAGRILAKGQAYRDFTPAASGDENAPGTYGKGPWLFNPGMPEMPREESDQRAAAGEPFVLRFRVPRHPERTVRLQDGVYGEQEKSTADIEDFALLRSNGMPTYHMASCADDADIRISHVIRGQDHLTNTFKHILIFEALGVAPPQFAHLPLIIAPDGSKLSKRRHGPVVSVTTYRDAGFLPHAFVNFISLLGWSPKNDREKMSREEMVEAFSIEGINRSNATINFKEDDPFDPKALWLNAEYIRELKPEELAAQLAPFANATREKLVAVAPLVRERIRTLSEAAAVADFIFNDELAPYDPAELVPQKGDAAMAFAALEEARTILASAEFTHNGLDAALRAGAGRLKIKTGQMFQPIRVAVCGRKIAPPLFETLEVLGREKCLKRIDAALALLKPIESR